MALIEWNDNLSVNIAEIDKQHRRLVDMINELNDAMKLGKGNAVLGKIINGLIDYTATHFGTEEKYFKTFGYPDAESHKKEHADFVSKVSEFKSGFNKGKLSVSVEVMRFLSQWLQNHIKVIDKKYGPFLNEKGLK